MPKPEHDGDWVAIATAVRELLDTSIGRPRSSIYEEIGAQRRAHPAIVRRAFAAAQALSRLSTEMTDIRPRIERLPLAAAEPIIRLIAIEGIDAASALGEYEARRIGVRDLVAKARTAQSLRPDTVRNAVMSTHRVVRQRLIAEFGQHAKFDFEELTTGRPRGLAGQFPELSGTGVDFVAMWGEQSQNRLAIFVVSSQSPDKAWGFQRRLMSNTWMALGMTRAGWRVIIATFGSSQASDTERYVRQIGVAELELMFWHFPVTDIH